MVYFSIDWYVKQPLEPLQTSQAIVDSCLNIFRAEAAEVRGSSEVTWFASLPCNRFNAIAFYLSIAGEKLAWLDLLTMANWGSDMLAKEGL